MALYTRDVKHCQTIKAKAKLSGTRLRPEGWGQGYMLKAEAKNCGISIIL